MISDFEERLAAALGAKIAAPFTGRVDVAPGGDTAGGARLVVGVTSAMVVEPDLGSRRPEVVPGSAVPRRAVRLDCTITLEVKAGSASRSDQLLALDAALYALDDAEFRSGSALAANEDRGFILQRLEPAALAAPLDPSVDNGPLAIRLSATGLFWPIGVEGKAGEKIGEIRTRSVILPIELVPRDPRIVAGGSPVELTLRFRTASFRETAGKSEPLPFDEVTAQLFAPGAKAGSGTLSGGVAGITPAVRILTLTNGETKVTYAPPKKPGIDELALTFPSLDKDLKKIPGLEIARATLRTRTS